MKLLEQIPKRYTLHFGPHGGPRTGFWAEIKPYGVTPGIEWSDSSHGRTPEEAIKNAIKRFNGQEKIYQGEDFDRTS